jgi:pentatricopeptide repeat protein
MKEQGLQPDRVAYNALFSALRVADMPEKAIELWREMIGKQSTKSSKIASARADSSLSPDIITVTDIIATLARSEARVQEVDQVFEEAVDRGIVFGKHSLDSHFEVDLSGMTLPVARAAVRFAMKRIKGNYLREKAELEGITFITGVGIAQLGRQKPNIVNESHSVNEQHTPMSLRDYIQSILSSDFFPSIQSNVPSLAQGTVEVTQGELKHWIEGQCTH